MHIQVVIDKIGVLLGALGMSMALPLVTAWIYQERAAYIFGGLMVLLLIISGLFRTILVTLQNKYTKKVRWKTKDNYIMITLVWIVAACVGMLPYLLTGTVYNITDAFFESMSGFTTVGVTVLDNVEETAKSVLLWRSMTHWLGGLATIVVFVMMISSVNKQAVQFFKIKGDSFAREKLPLNVSDGVIALGSLYLLNTVVIILLYKIAGMSWFEAINHGFSAVATGGFSTRTASIGGFESMPVQWAVIISMVISGMSYALIFHAWRTKNLSCFWQSLELKVYAAITLLATTLITMHILPQYDGQLFYAISDAAFQVLSVMTTTGWSAVDYHTWVIPAQLIIILLLFCGGCMGATTSGIKIDRHLILWKQAALELQRVIHPRIVKVLKINRQVVYTDTVHNVMTYFYLYMFVVALGTGVVVAFGGGFYDAFTTVASILGGVGPAVCTLTDIQSFAAAPTILKWLYICLMLLGRLEIYMVLVFFKLPLPKKQGKENRIVQREY
ncbi:MAG: TrkH family potassium uptake protein [Peptococcaceae bacterium]|nr:TrkH family potassium uptake protein [Peptococcaceae bacterium]